jgi:hypothetical protein
MNSTDISVRENVMRSTFYILTVVFVSLAVIGGVRRYSAVPFWDMWGAYVPFLDQANDSGWPAWWGQHNEHRILLARLFFWADLKWFSGASRFLIGVNFTLVGLSAVLFWRIMREVTVPPGRSSDVRMLAMFVVICLFFWSQDENLAWGFQIQFFLAHLIPLAALYSLYRSIQAGAGMFSLACLMGIMAFGTMANGVLTLPLMTVYAMLTRHGARRIGVLAFLTLLMLFAYFHDYAVSGPESITQAIRENPERLLRYVLTYLGSPFNYIVHEGAPGRFVALVAGLFFVVSSAGFAFRALRNPRQAAFQMALLMFITYIVGTAIGTGGRRLTLGVGQALSSRYTTPALMAWATLIVLYAPALLALQGRRRWSMWCAIVMLALLMLTYQMRALRSHADELFDRAVGALAIELRIKDMQEIGHVYSSAVAIETSAQAADKQRSVFGLYPFRDARAHMGTAFASVTLPACKGAVEAVESIDGDVRFLRIAGWLIEPVGTKAPQVVRFLDAKGRQIGYAIGGKPRGDIAAAFGTAASLAGFRGYLSAANSGEIVTLQGEDSTGAFCQMAIQTTRVSF